MNKERFVEAQKRIRDYVIKTPLIPLERLGDTLGFVPWVKLENMQNIGAFKIRGAMNAALQLTREELSKGLITASSGNHGRAVSYAAKKLGVEALIVLPNTVKEAKLKGVQELGALTKLVEPQQRIRIAMEIAQNKGYTFIHPFDDEKVIVGQGTLGLEILEQFPEVKRIVVPMGGGGLISGIAMAIKAIQPQIEIVGLEPKAVPKFSENLHRAIPEPVKESPSIADALLSNLPGSIALGVAKKYIDEIYSIEEQHIRKGYEFLLQQGKIFSEPSSAIGFGACFQGCFEGKNMENTVFLISGGNISVCDAAKIISQNK